jgi:hypothetical protein
VVAFPQKKKLEQIGGMVKQIFPQKKKLKQTAVVTLND